VINSISCVTPLNLGLIIGVVVAAFCCLLCLLILFIILGRRKIKRSKEETEIELKDKIASDSLTQYSIIPGLILTDETIQKFELDEKWNVEISELEIEREVGRGAFGVVYKGKWRGKKVAVKKILNLDFNQQQIEDFAKEIKLMQNLRPHQNVVGLLGVVRSPLSIITTFYANGSLFSLFKNTQIELPQIIKILKDVASGMLHLHREQIVHRDLAARNILLDDHMNAAVSDFGMSRIVQSGKSAITQSLVGPIKWMAPESLIRNAYSLKSDIWSYGITAWEALTGEEPYPEKEILEVAFLVRDGYKLEIPQNCPEELGNLILKCWSFDPADRPSIEEILEELEAIEKEMPEEDIFH